MNVRVSGRHGKAASRRTQLSRTLARVLAGWRTGLPGPVIVLQAGTAVNYFGTGLVLPFEIIYLHQARGFSTATAGLVLAAIMGTAAVVTPSSGALTRLPVIRIGLARKRSSSAPDRGVTTAAVPMTAASTSPAVAVEKPRTWCR